METFYLFPPSNLLDINSGSDLFLKKFAIGLTLGIVLTATTAVYASDTIQAVRQVFINGQLLTTNVQVSDDGTTMTSTRTLAEALGAKVSWNGQLNTVEIENQYPYFLSSLLHGKYNFKYEIIAENIIDNSDTTVVFSEGYKDIPDNTDFQKLFLLLLSHRYSSSGEAGSDV
ncbi:stalk domain-containing protein [Paenibacillus roseipurpureus]|uniref:Stalk domain-containing protein n=1 Tax=Paenibacillus roseopurpureus TaxID=2918901 RepID=A0AA96LYF3_9BACL|nr:stalk domain-containing protein [Paenibacillus sp. MBLB1832]WNR46825.1 stalk domain-containing protein [Paenibacillus sp. MBLB1832]